MGAVVRPVAEVLHQFVGTVRGGRFAGSGRQGVSPCFERFTDSIFENEERCVLEASGQSSNLSVQTTSNGGGAITVHLRDDEVGSGRQHCGLAIVVEQKPGG